MRYTSAATTEIAKVASAVEYELYLRPQNACEVVSTTSGTKKIVLSGDFTAHFTSGRVLWLIGTAASDGRYTLNGNSILSGGNTEIIVDESITTGSAGGHAFLRFEYEEDGLELTWDEDIAPSLRAALPNTGLDMSDETWPDSFTAVGCLAMAVSFIGSEYRVEMIAEVITVKPVDEKFALLAGDPRYSWVNNLAVVTSAVGPKEIVIDTTPRRELELLHDGKYGYSYGLISGGIGDEAFDAATGTKPRSWSDQGLRIWKHATDLSFTNAAGNEETYELAMEHYRVDYFSGAVTIIEADPDAAYWIEGVGAFEETQLGDEATTNGRNCDFARLFEAAGMYAAPYGGAGWTLGDEWGSAITAVNTGASRFTIAGDHTEYYKTGRRIFVQSSTGNDGTYSIDSVTTSSGNTLIVVNETVPDGTADGYVTLDTGLDMPGLMPFDVGKAARLLTDFADNFQRNIKPVYDPDLRKWYLLLVEQATAGNVDWELYHPAGIDQSREGDQIYTGVLLTGRKARPQNIVETAHAAGLIVDDSSGGSWTKWNGQDAEEDVYTFADVEPHICDGNATLGVLLHELGGSSGASGTADIDGGSTKYEGWWLMFSMEIDPKRPIQRIEVTAPGTRQERAEGGHQGYYWPGLRLEVYVDELADWFLVSPLLSGRFQPHSDIVIEKDQIPRRYGSQLRLLGGAYDHGIDIQTDPSVGVAELRVYQEMDYALRLSIAPLHPIIAVTTGVSGNFTVSGDATGDPSAFAAGDTFTVRGNAHAGTNTSWTVANAIYKPLTDTTDIVVTGTIDGSATASGELYTTTDYVLPDGTTVQRDYPDLWDRFGGTIRWAEQDMGDRYDEPLARVYGIQSLDDHLRAFQQATYETAGPDPRPKQWQSVAIVDEFNGDIDTLLIRRIVKTPSRTVISGTNYRTTGLGS